MAERREWWAGRHGLRGGPREWFWFISSHGGFVCSASASWLSVVPVHPVLKLENGQATMVETIRRRPLNGSHAARRREDLHSASSAGALSISPSAVAPVTVHCGDRLSQRIPIILTIHRRAPKAIKNARWPAGQISPTIPHEFDEVAGPLSVMSLRVGIIGAEAAGLIRGGQFLASPVPIPHFS
ncbi:hypothetical protein SCHPADRAFT_936777 [Schizopora paradoxa]|uniref:Uncharacterized protein n=1 Tax=Schizopora paradoxa TaxID=27342 RepID=A0A0H2SKY4_9AGAM|nr:hypothetical protein SCHPADRAFT_936777 [Schizopora paradoxa]